MNIEELAQKLGVETSVIEALKDEEKAKTFNIDEYVSEFEESQKNKFRKLFENDVDYKKRIEDETQERIYKTIDQQFKKHLPKEVFEESKHLKDKLNAFIELKSKDTSEDVKQLQDKVHQLNDLLEKKEEEVESEKKRLSHDFEQKQIKSILRDKLATVSDDKLIGKRDTVYKLLEGSVYDKYDLKLEEGKVKILQKGSDKIAEKGNKFLEVDELLADTLTEEGLIKQSNGKAPEEKPDVRVSTKTGEQFTKRSQASIELDRKLGLVS